MKLFPALSALLGLLALAACTPSSEVIGKRLYNDNCTACHGPTGQGDGPLSADLKKQPSDLTLISQHNGGTFPLTRVLSTIDGYTRSQMGNTVMPEFGDELQSGPKVLVDTGDGIETPTPARLVALAEYLRSIQR